MRRYSEQVANKEREHRARFRRCCSAQIDCSSTSRPKLHTKCYKDDSDNLAFKETTWLQICSPLNFFVQACTATFSAHSNLQYEYNKYPNRTTIRTSLKTQMNIIHFCFWADLALASSTETVDESRKYSKR